MVLHFQHVACGRSVWRLVYCTAQRIGNHGRRRQGSGGIGKISDRVHLPLEFTVALEGLGTGIPEDMHIRVNLRMFGKTLRRSVGVYALEAH